MAAIVLFIIATLASGKLSAQLQSSSSPLVWTHFVQSSDASTDFQQTTASEEDGISSLSSALHQPGEVNYLHTDELDEKTTPDVVPMVAHGETTSTIAETINTESINTNKMSSSVVVTSISVESQEISDEYQTNSSNPSIPLGTKVKFTVSDEDERYVRTMEEDDEEVNDDSAKETIDGSVSDITTGTDFPRSVIPEDPSNNESTLTSASSTINFTLRHPKAVTFSGTANELSDFPSRITLNSTPENISKSNLSIISTSSRFTVSNATNAASSASPSFTAPMNSTSQPTVTLPTATSSATQTTNLPTTLPSTLSPIISMLSTSESPQTTLQPTQNTSPSTHTTIATTTITIPQTPPTLTSITDNAPSITSTISSTSAPTTRPPTISSPPPSTFATIPNYPQSSPIPTDTTSTSTLMSPSTPSVLKDPVLLLERFSFDSLPPDFGTFPSATTTDDPIPPLPPVPRATVRSRTKRPKIIPNLFRPATRTPIPTKTTTEPIDFKFHSSPYTEQTTTTSPLVILRETIAPPVITLLRDESLDYPMDSPPDISVLFDEDQNQLEQNTPAISPATTNTIIVSSIIGGCAIIFFAILMIFCMWKQRTVRRMRKRRPDLTLAKPPYNWQFGGNYDDD